MSSSTALPPPTAKPSEELEKQPIGKSRIKMLKRAHRIIKGTDKLVEVLGWELGELMKLSGIAKEKRLPGFPKDYMVTYEQILKTVDDIQRMEKALVSDAVNLKARLKRAKEDELGSDLAKFVKSFEEKVDDLVDIGITLQAYAEIIRKKKEEIELAMKMDAQLRADATILAMCFYFVCFLGCVVGVLVAKFL